MKIEQLEKLQNKNKIIKNKINQLENRLMLESNKQRHKENNRKKRLASTFLLSNIFKLIGQTCFSRYEMFTIAGLIILNKLDNYTSDILMISYNTIIRKAINDNKFKTELFNLGKEKYIEDRKIEKDIEGSLQLIYGILIHCSQFIESNDIEHLRTKGQLEFVQIKDIQRQKKIDEVLKKIRQNR